MLSNLRLILKAHPSLKIVSVSDMDGAPAICPPDAILNQMENTTGGANFHAVQNIASALLDEFPDVLIEILAYGGSQQPPKRLKFSPNVAVRFVDSHSNKFEPLSHPSNAPVVDMFTRWRQLVKIATVWCNDDDFKFTLAPWPNYRVEGVRIREWAALGATGYLASGYPNPGTDMAALKTFVNARCMFDPFNSNATALVEAFSWAYFGNAAAHVLPYLQLFENSFQRNNQSLDYRGQPNHGGNSRHLSPTNAVYANDTLLQGGTLLKAAMVDAAAQGKTFVDRVAHVLMSLQYVVLLRWDQLGGYCTVTPACTWPFQARLVDEFDLFEAAYNMSGVHNFMEMDPTARHSINCNLACFRKQILGRHQI
jgi:hypothetical protein